MRTRECKVGMKVAPKSMKRCKIKDAHNKFPKGWHRDMINHIGKVGVIGIIDFSDGIPIGVKFKDKEFWWYYPEQLEKV